MVNTAKLRKGKKLPDGNVEGGLSSSIALVEDRGLRLLHQGGDSSRRRVQARHVKSSHALIVVLLTNALVHIGNLKQSFSEMVSRAESEGNTYVGLETLLHLRQVGSGDSIEKRKVLVEASRGRRLGAEGRSVVRLHVRLI